MDYPAINDVIKSRGIKVAVYGFAGSGKTRLLATIPGKGIVISAESGLLSLDGVPHAGEMRVAEIGSIKELREVYADLTQNPHDFSWVALDSISEIAEVVLTAEKLKTPDPRKAYGALIDEIGSVLRAFRDLAGMDVYFSVKAAKVKDETTGRVLVEMMFPGSKVAQTVPYLFDEVFFLTVLTDKETNETTHWLQTQSDARVDCKDRSGKLDAFEPADLGAVFAKIKGAVK